MTNLDPDLITSSMQHSLTPSRGGQLVESEVIWTRNTMWSMI